MKKLTLFSFAILLFVFSVNAQQKILFDNTKSEEAGNADWVIDHSEPTPYPSQSNITSSTSETYWDGAISTWGVEMVKEAFGLKRYLLITILPMETLQIRKIYLIMMFTLFANQTILLLRPKKQRL